MKKIYSLLLAVFTASSSIFALTPLTDWVKSISGTAAISHDASGNAYVTGSFSGTVDFDFGSGVSNLTSSGSTDIFAAKYTAAGNLVWAKRIGGTGADAGSSVVNLNGNMILSGSFLGTVDFNPGTAVNNLTSAGTTNADLFMLALNETTGDFSWVKKISGTNTKSGRISTIGGYLYMTGSYKGSVDFGGHSESTSGSGSNTTQEAFFVKYTETGIYVDMQVVEGSGNATGTGIAIDPSGNAYLLGHSSGSINTYPSTGGNGTITASGAFDIFIFKHNFNNSMYNNTWAYKFGSANQFSYAGGVVYTDKLIFTGSFAGTVDFNPGAGTNNISSAGGTSDMFVNALDANGGYLWTKTIGGASSSADAGRLATYNNDLYVTGTFSNTIDADPGAGVTSMTAVGIYDIFLVRLTASGDFVWGKHYGGTGTDYFSSVSVRNEHDIYFAGGFNSTATFETVTVTASGSAAFFGKLKTSCINTTSTITHGSCDPYTVNGQTYNQTGQYTQVRTNAQGCDSTITINFTRYVPTSSVLNRNGCNGSFTLNGQTYTSSGTYTQHRLNFRGCDSTITLNLTMINMDTDLSLTGYELSVTESNAGYQWINCGNGNTPIPGATSQTYTPTVPGTYAVKVTKGGCTETSICLAVNPPVGVEETAADAFRIFPNPSTGLVTITASADMTGAVLKIYTATGQVIHTKGTISGNDISLDLSAAAPGVYLAEIVKDGQVMRKKLIKE